MKINNNKAVMPLIGVILIIIVLFLAIAALSQDSFNDGKYLVVTDGTHFIDIDDENINFEELEKLNIGEEFILNELQFSVYKKPQQSNLLSSGSCDREKHSKYYYNSEDVSWCSLSAGEISKIFDEEESSVDRYWSDSDCGDRDSDNYKYYDDYKGQLEAWLLIERNYVQKCVGNGSNPQIIEDLKFELEEVTILHSNEILEYENKSQYQEELISRLQEANTQKQEQLINLSAKITLLQQKIGEVEIDDTIVLNQEEKSLIEWIKQLFNFK